MILNAAVLSGFRAGLRPLTMAEARIVTHRGRDAIEVGLGEVGIEFTALELVSAPDEFALGFDKGRELRAKALPQAIQDARFVTRDLSVGRVNEGGTP